MEATQERADLTGTALVRAVRALAAEHPTRIYMQHEDTDDGSPRCRYAPDPVNTLGCLIGAALARLGFPAQPEWDDQSTHDTSAHGIARRLGADVSSDQSTWLARAQVSQDGGSTWADAVLAADADALGRLGLL